MLLNSTTGESIHRSVAADTDRDHKSLDSDLIGGAGTVEIQVSMLTKWNNRTTRQLSVLPEEIMDRNAGRFGVVGFREAERQKAAALK